MVRFAEDTQVSAQGEGSFQCTVTDRWSINGNPNGGYLMGLLARAALRKAELRSTSIVTASFLSRTRPGPAEIRLEEIGRGAQLQRFQATLSQEGQERIRAFLTFTADDATGAVRYETGPTELAPRDRCVALPQLPTYTVFEGVELLLDPGNVGWMQGQPSERSENRGWMRFRDGESYDASSILLIADAMPPAILASRGMVAWVPTVELSVNVRRMPKSAWLNCVLRTRFVTGACLEADGEIWDEEGNLIAISRQIARIRTS